MQHQIAALLHRLLEFAEQADAQQAVAILRAVRARCRREIRRADMHVATIQSWMLQPSATTPGSSKRIGSCSSPGRRRNEKRFAGEKE
jgi:hypothetical protein